ncbi:MAG: hypothetical protein HQ559_06815, partial [Lentisphaerae bacterium]|nr:hypothetical protein [Lentisphaerota bacterium]
DVAVENGRSRRFLAHAVENGGKTLCFLGGDGAARPPDRTLVDALWPIDPDAVEAGFRSEADDGELLSRFCLTDVGRLHPVTAAMQSRVSIASEENVPGLLAGTRVLALAEPAGAPVMATRFAGKGIVFLVDHDQLWKRLNPTLLTGHAAMYVNLVSWAVDGDRMREETAGAPVLDRHVLSTVEGIQVWLHAGTTNDVVEAVVEGEIVASRPAVESRPGAGWAYAVFDSLPAKDIRFRIAGHADTSPVMVVEDIPELGFMSRNGAFLRSLAEGSGGRVGDVTELRRMLPEIPPRERIEKKERAWRLWDARSIFAFLILLLTAEWIWRKWGGLV